MKYPFKQINFTLYLVMILLFMGSCSTKQIKSGIENKNQIKKLPIVTIEMENGGIIKFEMYPESAPKTVARITELIQKGFYNGLTFHRVVPGFVVQGGCPLGNGTGGSGMKLPAEFNERKHRPGTVAMARNQYPHSADSQFYICLGTPSHLDGNYTIFGQVIDGMDVVNAIKMGDKMEKVSVKNIIDKHDERIITDREKKIIEQWLLDNNLNRYGDPQNTMYIGGTPLFDVRTGQSIERFEYILRKYPWRPWEKD